MRIKLSLLVLLGLIIFASFPGFAQTSGGPDAYGYTWIDSDNSNGPAFSWVDITTKPNASQITGLGDDNSVGMFSMGWNFPYYWNSYGEVKIGSNGWVGFKNIGNIASCYPTIPTPGGSGDNYLAPFMSDLNFGSNNGSFTNPASLWTWSNGVDTFIVTYKNVPWWKNDNGGANPPNFAGNNTFQVILSGVDSSITFQYQATTPSDWYDSPGCSDDMVIGIENVTGNIGLQLPTNVVPLANYVVRFTPPSVPLLSIPDPSPVWNANQDNKGQFFISNAQVNLKTNIANVGNAAVNNPISVNGEIRDLPLNTIYTGNKTLAAMPTGGDSTVTFSPAWAIPAPGQYYFNTEITCADDVNPSNNSNSIEISAVDCTNDTMSLTYATLNPPDGALSWQGGGQDGVGIYIDPPIHPVTIESIEYFVLGDGDTTTPLPVGFIANLFAEDVAGNPGTQLFTQTISAGNVTEGDWNKVTLSSPQTITSGGFYVSWLQEGSGIGIGTESFGPISRRTYEILSGSWATYRSATTSDFLIKVNVSTDCSVGRDRGLSQLQNLELFPNPAHQSATLRWTRKTAGNPTVEIWSMLGTRVFGKEMGWSNAGEIQLNLPLEHLVPGTYMVVVTENGAQCSRKLVISE
ncbi:MAG: T9SS type A sorting domain-containing protein [Bacteroidia bacterium]|nr:T9SS type A sorting domain-containing protein [Bacteroidia bacterium]